MRQNHLPIALATSAAFPELDSDDANLRAELAARGLEARPAIWTDASIDWATFSLCVLRSTWDYFHRVDEFAQWIARVATATSLWNPASVVLPNLDKTYLRALAAQGVPIVATEWIAPGVDVRALLDARGFQRVVLKPSVSGNAHRTVRATLGDAAQQARALFDAGERALMVQPYLEAIEREGELSLVFIDGALSHAVRKSPAAGDFRVQEGHGGTTTRVTPSDEARSVATRALAAIGERTLYARADLVRDASGALVVMELELTEPSLYFALAPEGAARFADAIAAELHARG